DGAVAPDAPGQGGGRPAGPPPPRALGEGAPAADLARAADVLRARARVRALRGERGVPEDRGEAAEAFEGDPGRLEGGAGVALALGVHAGLDPLHPLAHQ